VKSISLKIVPLCDDYGKPIVGKGPNGEDVPATLDYRKQLIAIVKQPLDPKGMDIAEVEASLRVLAVLRAAEAMKTCQLEDADYAHLMQKVQLQRWAVATQEILTFVADIGSASG